MFCAITHTARFTIIIIITYFAILWGKKIHGDCNIFLSFFFFKQSSGEMLRPRASSTDQNNTYINNTFPFKFRTALKMLLLRHVILQITFYFTLGNMACAFIQSNLHCIFFSSIGVEAMTLALLVSCSYF